MTSYQVTAIITLASIDLTREIEASSREEAMDLMEARVYAGEFDEEIDARAMGRDFEVDTIEVDA